MAKFREKPIVIEAEQWWTFSDVPDAWIQPLDPDRPTLGWLVTLEGGCVVTPGDWIITGIWGERYLCKPSIFEDTYEQVEE